KFGKCREQSRDRACMNRPRAGARGRDSGTIGSASGDGPIRRAPASRSVAGDPARGTSGARGAKGMQMTIPFNRPFIAGKELYYVAQAVTYGNLGGDGRFTQSCSRLLEERFGIGKVL